jgi:exopolysaccharide biosynthesis polyprenyl glycosylphosphotransferase
LRTKIRYILPLIYILVDTLGILVSFYLAYKIRFYSPATGVFPITKGIPELSLYLQALIFVGFVWIFIFGLMGHYRSRPPSSFDRFWEAVRGVSSGSIIIMATTFFYRGESFSRLVMGFAWILGIAILYLFREIAYRFELHMLRRGLGVKRAVFVGDHRNGLLLFEKLKAQPAWGIVPVGFVSDEEIELPWLGRINDLEDIVKSQSIDLIIFNLPPDRRDFIAEFVMKSENLKTEYMISPDVMGIMTFNSEAGQIEGIPVVRWGRTPIEGYARLVKRLFDFTFSGLGIVLFSPLIAAIGLAVKLDSRGPVFFKQRRVGRNGLEFDMYKFRSMRHDDDNQASDGWTVRDDPRRTRVGRFIRKYSLDELPQLFNVFVGQMSLVGPRPEQPGYVDRFKDDIPRYFQRHKVKSGVTGWAQVNGFRGDTSIAQRTKYDLYYVENWSLVLDIKIILLTIRGILRSPNAY